MCCLFRILLDCSAWELGMFLIEVDFLEYLSFGIEIFVTGRILFLFVFEFVNEKERLLFFVEEIIYINKLYLHYINFFVFKFKNQLKYIN